MKPITLILLSATILTACSHSKTGGTTDNAPESIEVALPTVIDVTLTASYPGSLTAKPLST